MRDRTGKVVRAAVVASAGALVMFGLAWAQESGPGGLGAGGGPFLLAAPAFQVELKLTRAQAEKVEPALRALAREHREEMLALRDLAPRERTARQRALLRRMNAALKKSLEFTPEQSRRFDQVSLQHRRFEAFTDPEVVARLRLTDDQRRRLAEIARSSHDRMQEILKGAAADRPEAMRRAAALSREMTGKAVDLLDDAQKAVWKEMTGPPFEIPAGRPPGP
jgi:hypothetical protein